MCYILNILLLGGYIMKKSTSISIRVREDELELFKNAAEYESYG